MILELISSQSFILVVLWMLMVLLSILHIQTRRELKAAKEHFQLDVELFGTSTAVLSKDLLSAVIISFMVVMNDLEIDVPSIGRHEREIEYFNRLWSIYKKHMYSRHVADAKEPKQ